MRDSTLGPRSWLELLVLRFYAASGDNPLPASRSRSCPETSIRNYRNSMRKNPEERSSRITNLLIMQFLQSSATSYLLDLHYLPAPYSRTPSVFVLPLAPDTKFHTHIPLKHNADVYVYIYIYSTTRYTM